MNSHLTVAALFYYWQKNLKTIIFFCLADFNEQNIYQK